MNLGELADLTVANDNDLSMDVMTPLLWNNAWDVSHLTLADTRTLTPASTFVPSDARQQGGVQEDVEPPLYTTQPLRRHPRAHLPPGPGGAADGLRGRNAKTVEPEQGHAL